MDPVAILQDYRASVVDWETLLAHVTAHTTWQVQLAMLREGLASGKLPEAEADTEWPHSQPQLSD